MITSHRYPPDHLHQFICRAFEHCDVPSDDAIQAADVLLQADLRGIDSHGIARLDAYFAMLQNGRVNPKPRPKVERASLSTATLDGDNGMGLVVGPHAHRLAMDKADEAGSGWVAVSNSNHFGIAGYYPLMSLNRDQIGVAMTNASKIVTPLWGSSGMLGTNPIAIAFPGLEEPPIVIDMATSVVAYGKIEVAHRQGAPIPEGWAVDAAGNATNTPSEMMHGGALLPLGGSREQGGHKGYALASMVDIMSSLLSGANWGPFAPPFAPKISSVNESVGKGLGHFFGSWKIEAFRDPEAFKSEVDTWIRTFRQTPPAPGTSGPLIPGDPERLAEAERQETGIPLLEPVIQSLNRIGKQIGIPFD